MKLSIIIAAACLWAGLAGAAPTRTGQALTPVGLLSTEVTPWLGSVKLTGVSPKRKDMTNAERIKRGLPIDKPKRLFKPMQPRAVAAPSAVVAGSATFYLRGCNRGGDGYSSSIPVSGSLQEMTEQCAAYQAGITGGNGVFAIWPGGNTCYADITFPPNQPADCDSAGAIIADYSQ